MVAKAKKPGHRTEWKNEWYVQIYDLAKGGSTDLHIQQTLGITWKQWKWRMENDKALKEALSSARDGKILNGVRKFHIYVYHTLPPDLRELWKEIMAVEECRDRWERVAELLRQKPIRFRQNLFLYALVHYNFVISKALVSLNLDHTQVEQWMLKDPRFRELMDYIHRAKKDFCEGKLMELVAAGDPSAVIFVNKTLNKDRGYNEKIDINVSGELGVGLDIDRLPISLSAKRELLVALRQQNHQENIIDGTPVKELLALEPGDKVVEYEEPEKIEHKPSIEEWSNE